MSIMAFGIKEFGRLIKYYTTGRSEITNLTEHVAATLFVSNMSYIIVKGKLMRAITK